METMKNQKSGFDYLTKKFLQLPNIEKIEYIMKTEKGFICSVEMSDGYEFKINAYVILRAFPSDVMQLIDKQDKREGVSVIISPYISDRTALICRENSMGYFDYAGNCWFVGHSLYMFEKGNSNPQPKEYKAISVFEQSSVVSSVILRELFVDVSKKWRIKSLAESAKCSIGQVSKVVNYLADNAWVEKTADGYVLADPESLLKAWSDVYGKKKMQSYSCYSLDNITVIENKLGFLKNEMGIQSYLTGLAGGVRYAPVVRYNKVYMYISPEDIQESIDYLGMKEVESGANVVIFPLENDSYIIDSRIINGTMVVSPVQVYLDSMQLKARGEEMAEAVLRKEIIK